MKTVMITPYGVYYMNTLYLQYMSQITLRLGLYWENSKVDIVVYIKYCLPVFIDLLYIPLDYFRMYLGEGRQVSDRYRIKPVSGKCR